MTRRHALLMFSAFGSLLALAGCGGNNKVNTGGDGRLADVEISPLPGATFLPRSTVFTIFWSEGFAPPPTFSARIYRLQSDGTIDEIGSRTPEKDGDANRWFFESAGDLPANTAIYVELGAAGESTLRFAYIVGNNRSEGTPRPSRTSGAIANIHTVYTNRP